MLEILNQNVDNYLKDVLGIKYTGYWNGVVSKQKPRRKDGKKNFIQYTPKKQKYKIIDSLISKVQRRKYVERSYKALILIFAPTFKQVHNKYAGTLIGQFRYSSDEIMIELISHLYELIITDFKRKSHKEFVANFNHYAISKLHSKALCMISAEKNRRGYESGKIKKKKKYLLCKSCKREYTHKNMPKVCDKCGAHLEIYESVSIIKDLELAGIYNQQTNPEDKVVEKSIRLQKFDKIVNKYIYDTFKYLIIDINRIKILRQLKKGDLIEIRSLINNSIALIEDNVKNPHCSIPKLSKKNNLSVNYSRKLVNKFNLCFKEYIKGMEL